MANAAPHRRRQDCGSAVVITHIETIDETITALPHQSTRTELQPPQQTVLESINGVVFISESQPPAPISPSATQILSSAPQTTSTSGGVFFETVSTSSITASVSVSTISTSSGTVQILPSLSTRTPGTIGTVLTGLNSTGFPTTGKQSLNNLISAFISVNISMLTPKSLTRPADKHFHLNPDFYNLSYGTSHNANQYCYGKHDFR